MSSNSECKGTQSSGHHFDAVLWLWLSWDPNGPLWLQQALGAMSSVKKGLGGLFTLCHVFQSKLLSVALKSNPANDQCPALPNQTKNPFFQVAFLNPPLLAGCTILSLGPWLNRLLSSPPEHAKSLSFFTIGVLCSLNRLKVSQTLGPHLLPCLIPGCAGPVTNTRRLLIVDCKWEESGRNPKDAATMPFMFFSQKEVEILFVSISQGIPLIYIHLCVLSVW